MALLRAMGLFGDLPTAKDSGSTGDAKTPGKDVKSDGTVGSWSGAGSKLRAPPRKPATMLNPQMLKAQAAALRAQQAKLARDREQASARTPTGPTKTTGDVAPSADPASPVEAPEPTPEPVADAWGTLSADVEDEYDPLRPNSYEDAVRARERRRAEEEEAEAREARRLILEGQRAALAKVKELRRGGAPPDRSVLNVSGEEAFLRRAQLGDSKTKEASTSGATATGTGTGTGTWTGTTLGTTPPGTLPGSETVPAASASGGGAGMSAAQRMMMKMGWKEGQGLGKSDQGMTTPLEVRKDGARSGVIVAAPETFVRAPEPPEPSKVLLLRNVVAPGEVDEDLEDEVAEECEKFGPVVRVLIFELEDLGRSAGEAVRVFAEFTEAASAARCLEGMNGRFFGGRTIRASYYSEALFAENELGPQPGESPA